MNNVYLTAAAFDDLQLIHRKDQRISRLVLKKIIQISRRPRMGEALHGELVGFRKAVVGDNHWRIVWRVTTDSLGHEIVEIAEIWAIGARSNAQVYQEMRKRLASVADNPDLLPLSQLVELFEKKFRT